MAKDTVLRQCYIENRAAVIPEVLPAVPKDAYQDLKAFVESIMNQACLITAGLKKPKLVSAL